MFCPKCGVQVPDDAKFCPACCEPMAAQEAPVTEPQLIPACVPAEPAPMPEPAPAVTPMPQAAPVAVAPVKPVKKGNLISNLFDSKLRVLAVFALLIWLGAMAVTYISYETASNTQLTELPVVTALSSTEDIELIPDEKTKNELSEALKDAKAAMKEELSGLSKEDYQKVENLIETAEDLLEDPTLGNLQATLPQLNEVLDVVEENKEYFESSLPNEDQQINSFLKDIEQLNEYSQVLNIVPYVLKGFLILCLFFTLLGGLFKLNGMLFSGMFFTALFTGIFAGIPYLAAACGLHILLMIFNGFLNKPYKQYKKSLKRLR